MSRLFHFINYFQHYHDYDQTVYCHNASSVVRPSSSGRRRPCDKLTFVTFDFSETTERILMKLHRKQCIRWPLSI